MSVARLKLFLGLVGRLGIHAGDLPKYAATHSASCKVSASPTV